MRRFLIISFLFLTALIKCQTACTWTSTPTDIYYPNTTSTPTVTGGLQYLCGPNTVVYDTLIAGCYFMFVDNNSTLFFKSLCTNAMAIRIRSTATLNILPGSTGVIQIAYEPGASINNPSGTYTVLTMCPSIAFPYVNCSTGLVETYIRQTVFKVYPNPSATKINIELLNSNDLFADIIIRNQLGEIVNEKKQWVVTEKEIFIDNLSSGSYLIQVKTKLGQQTEKLIILR